MPVRLNSVYSGAAVGVNPSVANDFKMTDVDKLKQQNVLATLTAENGLGVFAGTVQRKSINYLNATVLVYRRSDAQLVRRVNVNPDFTFRAVNFNIGFEAMVVCRDEDINLNTQTNAEIYDRVIAVSGM